MPPVSKAGLYAAIRRDALGGDVGPCDRARAWCRPTDDHQGFVVSLARATGSADNLAHLGTPRRQPVREPCAVTLTVYR
jgi:hypothetical protein